MTEAWLQVYVRVSSLLMDSPNSGTWLCSRVTST